MAMITTMTMANIMWQWVAVGINATVLVKV